MMGTFSVKRAVAIEGDRVAIVQKRLVVNGRDVEEPWVRHRDPRVFDAGAGMPEARRDNMSELTVPPGMLFVLGDNRDASYDSRFFGFVHRDSVIGTPLYLYWATDLSRIGKPVRPRGAVS